MFIKGQKVICIDDSYNPNIIQDKIYEINYVDDIFIRVLNNRGADALFNACRFKTIIQSLDDVVPGMTLTLKDNVFNWDTSGNGGEIIVFKTINEGISDTSGYGYHKDIFKEYTPNVNIPEVYYIDKGEVSMRDTEYEVVNSFTILDIYKKDLCKEEFEALLEEEDVKDHSSIGCWAYTDSEDIQNSKVLMRNLPWLEGNGFIQENVKDVVLELGMKLQCDSNTIYTVIESGDSIFEWNGISLYCERHKQANYGFIFSYGKTYPKGITLSDLNKLTSHNFKVVKDED